MSKTKRIEGLQQVATRTLRNRLKAALAAAQVAPLVIRTRTTPVAVVLSVEFFAALVGKASVPELIGRLEASMAEELRERALAGESLPAEEREVLARNSAYWRG